MMPKEAIGGEVSTLADVALLFADVPSNALTGESSLICRDWFIE